MEGRRYGLWTVGKQAGNTTRGGAVWNAVCDCGTARSVLGADLRQGKSVSCGCDKNRKTGDRSRTHGQSKTRLNNIWRLMRSRCEKPKNTSYPNYGGRGISVCPEWQTFTNFRDWALANGYSPELSIERVDVNGNYCPDNCAWATNETQSNNRRFVRKMPDGRPAPLVAKENGIPAKTFNVRVHAGWSIEKAATHPYRTLRQPRVRDENGRFT